MEEQRRVLAALMKDAGCVPDKKPAPAERPSICGWFFYCSFCPHDVLEGTRESLGPCTRLHDRSMDFDPEEARSYTIGLRQTLERLVEKRDAVILARRTKLEEANEHVSDSSESESDAELAQLTKRAREQMHKAEEFGNIGKVSDAEDALAAAAALGRQHYQRRASKLLAGQLSSAPPQQQRQPRRPPPRHRRLRCCEVCGAYLPAKTPIQYMFQHAEGRGHRAWARLREELAELRRLFPPGDGDSRSYRAWARLREEHAELGRHFPPGDGDSRSFLPLRAPLPTPARAGAREATRPAPDTISSSPDTGPGRGSRGSSDQGARRMRKRARPQTPVQPPQRGDGGSASGAGHAEGREREEGKLDTEFRKREEGELDSEFREREEGELDSELDSEKDGP